MTGPTDQEDFISAISDPSGRGRDARSLGDIASDQGELETEATLSRSPMSSMSSLRRHHRDQEKLEEAPPEIVAKLGAEIEKLPS